MCVSLFRHSNRGLITKGTIGSPVGKRPPFAKRVVWCTKHNETESSVAKIISSLVVLSKNKRNNGRTPFAGVYKFVCVWQGKVHSGTAKLK